MDASVLVSFLAEGIIYLALFISTVYAVVFAYHWFQYGSKRSTSTTALLLYIAGAIICLSLMFGGYWFMWDHF